MTFFGRVDAGFLQRFCDGERPAMESVYRSYVEPQTRRTFDGSREYGPFLRQIARNVVVDHLRRRQRQTIRDSEALAGETRADPGPNELPADRNTIALVGDYVARLSPEMRRVHEAMYVRGLSQRETAAALGLGRQVVRTLEAHSDRGSGLCGNRAHTRNRRRTSATSALWVRNSASNEAR